VPVIGGDNDKDSVRVARENAVLNGLRREVKIINSNGYRATAIRSQAPFDLVCANILANPLIELAPALTQVLARNGRAVLSGLLQTQEQDVLAAHRALGLELDFRLRLKDWSVLVLRWADRKPAAAKKTAAKKKAVAKKKLAVKGKALVKKPALKKPTLKKPAAKKPAAKTALKASTAAKAETATGAKAAAKTTAAKKIITKVVANRSTPTAGKAKPGRRVAVKSGSRQRAASRTGGRR